MDVTTLTTLAAPSPTVPPSALELSHRQHGLVSREQLRGLGLSQSAIRNQLAQGDWAPVSRRVLVRPGAAGTGAQRLMAVVLDVGLQHAYICCRAAAFWYGVPASVRCRPT